MSTSTNVKTEQRCTADRRNPMRHHGGASHVAAHLCRMKTINKSERTIPSRNDRAELIGVHGNCALDILATLSRKERRAMEKEELVIRGMMMQYGLIGEQPQNVQLELPLSA